MGLSIVFEVAVEIKRVAGEKVLQKLAQLRQLLLCSKLTRSILTTGLVSNETEVLHWWGSEIQNFGFIS